MFLDYIYIGFIVYLILFIYCPLKKNAYILFMKKLRRCSQLSPCVYTLTPFIIIIEAIFYC